MNRKPVSETKDEIFGKMMAALGGETNLPAVTANSQAKMMKATFGSFLSEMTPGEKEKQTFEFINEAKFELMRMAGRLSGFSDGLAAVAIAAQEGINGINEPKEVLGVIIDFIGELQKYNVGTLQLGRNCSKRAF